MPKYKVTFDGNRIGRTHTVSPTVIEASTDDILETKILKYARPHLRSRDVEVIVDTETEPKRGTIWCGMQVGASFSLTAE